MQTIKSSGATAAPSSPLVVAPAEDAADRIMAMVDVPAMDAFIPRGPRVLQKARELAEVFWKASQGGGGLLPESVTKGKSNPIEAVMAHIIYGQEIGLRPMRALQALYNVHGRWSMYAADMMAMVQSNALCEYLECEEASAGQATWVAKRRGGRKERRLTVTIAQARQAGWTSNKKYETEPDQMLKWRALSRICQEVFGDVLRGMATMEELNDAGIRLEEREVNPRTTPPPKPAAAPVVETVDPVTGEVSGEVSRFETLLSVLDLVDDAQQLAEARAAIIKARDEKAITDEERTRLLTKYNEAGARVAARLGGGQ